MREISLTEALALLRWPAYRVRLRAVLAGRASSKPFHSDPASGASARGREYDLDGGRRWRLIATASRHYVARHTSARDFEYWRITDWPG